MQQIRHMPHIVLDSTRVCRTAVEVVRSSLCRRVLWSFIKTLYERRDPLLKVVATIAPVDRPKRFPAIDVVRLQEALALLVNHTPREAAELDESLNQLPDAADGLYQFVEKLYDFWRSRNRFLIHTESPPLSTRERFDSELVFMQMMGSVRQLVLEAYRRICVNLTSEPFNVLRQLSSGASVGLVVHRYRGPSLPWPYDPLMELPYIWLALLEPPVKRPLVGRLALAGRSGPGLAHVALHDAELFQMLVPGQEFIARLLQPVLKFRLHLLL